MPGGTDIILGQLDGHAAVELQIPAAPTDPHRRRNVRAERRLAREHFKERGRRLWCIVADQDDQIRELVETWHRHYGAIAIDQLQLALALPERERLALRHLHIKRVGQYPLDRSSANPRERLQARLCPGWADGEHGRAARGTQRRKNL